MLKVAVITHDFSGFTGSEIVALEIANYFAERGNDVVIRAERYSDLIYPHLHERVSVSPVRIDISKFDIVWSQHGHFSFNTQDLHELKKWEGLFISCHLSSSTPAEIYHYPFAAKYAGGLIFNAERVENELTAKRKPKGHACNFRNAAPKRFHQSNVKKSDSLTKILVVSNHLPDDVREALSILRSMGISCQHIGREGISKLIEPSDILAVDAVISIGKTVQYSLVGGCPVYCYDNCGGPGWLSETNFELAEMRNFSGRCAGIKKTAQQIVDELVIGYAGAQEFTSGRVSYFQERYNLEATLDSFMDSVRISGSGNYFNSEDCIDDIDLMRGGFAHFGWIWHDVFAKDHIQNAQLMRRELDTLESREIEHRAAHELLELKVRELERLSAEEAKGHLETIRVLSRYWFLGLVLEPWRPRKWNRIRKLQHQIKSELKAVS
ncbi:glycosyltransferase [Brucella sp. 21LCYQ03]|nr:glycosyltransferase [Brucella sp. 21LCYQ03]